MAGNRIYSVTQLNNEIKGLLESNPSFRNLFVQGEISNLKLHTSGHVYLTLKDQDAAISAVMFRSDAEKLRFRLQNGMKVVARGRISSFPKSGQVQLYLSDMMPDGAGALHMAYEQLKEKLFREGLFDQACKKTLPAYPLGIALVTSPTGAAVQDMLRILKRRWPAAQVKLFPALVQGKDAPGSLVRALRLADSADGVDLIITGRGGGSLEDLWAFNDEAVARAIFSCRLPVISAVGHEPDVTIADFVADKRAPTPSAAAELAVPDCEEVRYALRLTGRQLRTVWERRLSQTRTRMDSLADRLALRSPMRYVADRRAALAVLDNRLAHAAGNMLADRRLLTDYAAQRLTRAQGALLLKKRAEFGQKAAGLDALSPLKVLARGYAVATDRDGGAVMDSGALSPGDWLRLRFYKGTAECKVVSSGKARN